MANSRYIGGLGDISQLAATTLLLCLCSFIGCSTEEELQPARLMEARGYHKNTPLESFPLPVNGGGIIGTTTTIELVFDKPVLEVSINYSAKAQPDEMPPTTIWKLESNRLESVWNRRNKNVTLTVIYEDDTGIHKDTLDVTLDLQSDSPRVIAVDPPPGAQRTEAVDITYREVPRQEFRITFNEPIIPNSGRILFGTSPYIATIQLQETEATDTITWNQCYRPFFLDYIGSMEVRDFQNVNGDVQPRPYVGWYRMPVFDPGPAVVIEYYPIGQDVDPETTRFIRVVFNRSVYAAICQIAPAITLSPAHVENDSIKSCTGVVTWEFVGTEQLNYSTKYDVKIEVEDFAGTSAFDYSFSTRAAPF